MPIYLYKCGECSQTCEALQHINDAPLTECPHCHATALHKIIAPCGIVFKGHGFYKTDNPSSSAAPVTHPDDTKSEGGTEASSKGEQNSTESNTATESAAASGSESSKAAPQGEARAETGGKAPAKAT